MFKPQPRTKYFAHIDPPLTHDPLVAVMTDEGRFYETPQGNRYPSVTTVLGRETKEHIEQWKKRVGEKEAARILGQASSRGTQMHAICEDYLGNVEGFLHRKMPYSVAMFKSIAPIIDENINLVYGIEIPLYSDVLKTAGRCDLFCQFGGVNTIVDFKTSSKVKKKEWIDNYFIQATTYAIMVEERHGLTVPQVAIIMAVEDEQPMLFVEQTKDWTDRVHTVFLNQG